MINGSFKERNFGPNSIKMREIRRKDHYYQILLYKNSGVKPSLPSWLDDEVEHTGVVQWLKQYSYLCPTQKPKSRKRGVSVKGSRTRNKSGKKNKPDRKSSSVHAVQGGLPGSGKRS